MSFAAFMPRRDWLNGHLVLARRIDSPRFLRIAALSPGNVVHAFRLAGPAEVDQESAVWLAEAADRGLPCGGSQLRSPGPPRYPGVPRLGRRLPGAHRGR